MKCIFKITNIHGHLKLDKENEQKVKKQNKTAESIAYSYHKSILITPAY